MPTDQTSSVFSQIRRAALLRDGGGMTDGQLLESFVNGRDEAAFEALVRRHGPMVLGVCRRVLHDPQDSEDAFQATFLVLVRKAPSIAQRELVANWLYGVAYRIALDARATAMRRRARERQVCQMPEPVETDARDSMHDLRPLLDQELNRLPDKYRLPIVLCDLEGRTRRDVARQLGIPVGTLSGRLTTARAMLAKRLARRGLVISGPALATTLTRGAASACVPSPLMVSTVGAASAIAGGKSAEVVSAKVAALVDGSMKAMLVKKLKIAIAVLLVTGSVAALSLSKPQAIGEESEETKQTSQPRVIKLGSRGRRVVWSPDGKTLAVVTKNETLFSRKGSAIKLWDVEKGLENATLAEDSGGGLAFQQVAFSADGKTIAATVSEEVILPNGRMIRDVVKVWDAKTLNVQQTFGDNSQMSHVAFSPDSKLLGACDPSKKSVKLWDPATGALERTLDTGEAQPWSAVFSPDGKTLVVGGQKADHSGIVTLWESKTGKLKHTLHPEKYVTAMAFSPDGKTIASSGGGELVQVWGVENGDEIVSIKGNKRGPRTITFLAGGKIVAVGGSDGRVRLWDARTGKLQDTLNGHTSEIHAIALSPDGKTLASVSQDETLRLWPINKKPSGAK
jgi:RNA polymerase sigma factor (sigma-70 family)